MAKLAPKKEQDMPVAVKEEMPKPEKEDKTVKTDNDSTPKSDTTKIAGVKDSSSQNNKKRMGGAGRNSATSNEFLFVVRNGKAVKIPVRSGISDDVNIQIIDGIKGAEEIITGPFKSLRELYDDCPVTVKNAFGNGGFSGGMKKGSVSVSVGGPGGPR
jgi:hypothetical protein